MNVTVLLVQIEVTCKLFILFSMLHAFFLKSQITK